MKKESILAGMEKSLKDLSVESVSVLPGRKTGEMRADTRMIRSISTIFMHRIQMFHSRKPSQQSKSYTLLGNSNA